MQKIYISLGLMSGTSGDGVDASIIIPMELINLNQLKTNILNMILDIYKDIHNLKEKIYKKKI